MLSSKVTRSSLFTASHSTSTATAVHSQLVPVVLSAQHTPHLTDTRQLTKAAILNRTHPYSRQQVDAAPAAAAAASAPRC